MSDDVLEVTVRAERKDDGGVDVSFKVIEGAAKRALGSPVDPDYAKDAAALTLLVDHLRAHPELLFQAVRLRVGSGVHQALVKRELPREVWSRYFGTFEKKLQARRRHGKGRET